MDLSDMLTTPTFNSLRPVDPGTGPKSAQARDLADMLTAPAFAQGALPAAVRSETKVVRSTRSGKPDLMLITKAVLATLMVGAGVAALVMRA